MKYQLCSTDEYGSTVIHESNDDFDRLVSAAKKIVNDENVTNPFTADQKKANWELGFIEIVDENDEPIDDAFYAGKNNKGKHCVQRKDGDKEMVEIASTSAKIRVYLGNLDREDWYAETRKALRGDKGAGPVRLLEQRVSDPTDSALLEKTIYFIRRVN